VLWAKTVSDVWTLWCCGTCRNSQLCILLVEVHSLLGLTPILVCYSLWLTLPALCSPCVLLSGEEPVLGPTPAELDNAREQLDQAQEELVGLMERCDRLEQELEIARRKNRVYQVMTAELYSVCWRVMVTLCIPER
jgi:hypothetical protein